MRVHIALYDTTHGEAAVSGWVTVRSIPGAHHRAHTIYRDHRADHGANCTLDAYVLSRYVAGVAALQTCGGGRVQNGDTD